MKILPQRGQARGTRWVRGVGEDTREILERRPASAVVAQLIYPKFGRKDRSEDSAPHGADVADLVPEEVVREVASAATRPVLAAPALEFPSSAGVPAPLCCDATGVLVLAPERCKNGHFWVLVAPEKHVLFRFSARHDSAAVDKLLGEYTGVTPTA